MTSAFDAAIAECQRLRLRWEYRPNRHHPELPVLTISSLRLSFDHDEGAENVVSAIRQVLSERCGATRFRKRGGR